MSISEDTNFNHYFVRDDKGRVSLDKLSDKLDLDEETLLKQLQDLDVRDVNGIYYLYGWKYKDSARTPAPLENQNKQYFKEPVIPQQQDKSTKSKDSNDQFLEKYKLKMELEDYKQKLKLKNKELDNHKEIIRAHVKEKSDLEDSYRLKLEGEIEKISLGHSLNERIQNILNKTKQELETLSGKPVNILLLADFHNADKRHSRNVFIPKDQNYTFEIGHEQKHQNPDLRTHFM